MTDSSSSFSFGDSVRFKDAPHTLQAQIGGLEGVIHGFTTPSATGVRAVGPLADDFALNVYVEALGQDFWVDPSDIERVSRPEIMEFSVAGNTIRVTQKDGDYTEEIIGRRPWWKFW